jgi:hypothetical protein
MICGGHCALTFKGWRFIDHRLALAIYPSEISPTEVSCDRLTEIYLALLNNRKQD